MRAYVVETRKADSGHPWDLLEMGWGQSAHVMVFKDAGDALDHARAEHLTGYEERVVRADLLVRAPCEHRYVRTGPDAIDERCSLCDARRGR